MFYACSTIYYTSYHLYFCITENRTKPYCGTVIYLLCSFHDYCLLLILLTFSFTFISKVITIDLNGQSKCISQMSCTPTITKSFQVTQLYAYDSVSSTCLHNTFEWVVRKLLHTSFTMFKFLSLTTLQTWRNILQFASSILQLYHNILMCYKFHVFGINTLFVNILNRVFCNCTLQL